MLSETQSAAGQNLQSRTASVKGELHYHRYYYYHNSGLQQQYVLYGQDSLKAEPVCLLDPNTLSDDGTVALKDATFSDNGQLMAYSLSSGGSDWASIKVWYWPHAYRLLLTALFDKHRA
jgi:prolyl oligopeptidase PreP (S9A serine peptidase family)